MMMSRGVCFSPEASFYTKHGGAAKVGENETKKKVTLKIWIFKLQKGSGISVGSFFKNIGEKVAKALPPTGRRRCSGKVSSSASLGRSRSYAGAFDSQRAEAIEDCIEFLNSSSSSSSSSASSLHRSNSVSSSC